MKNNENIDIINDEINYVFESMINIERQIEYFNKRKSYFFYKGRNKQFDDRIKMLEDIRKYLYRRLEYLIDNRKI